MKNSRSLLTVCAIAFSVVGLCALLREPKTPKVSAPKTSSPNVTASAPLRVLVVGGGPDLDNNQVAIESNVRYLNRLLSPKTPRTVLFADGKAERETVLFDRNLKLSRGGRLYQLIWENGGPQEIESIWRGPQLGWKCDGASKNASIRRAFGQITRDSLRSPSPLLLYFTGHGSPKEGDSNDNVYDLWNGESLSVRVLAKQIARLPRKTPVTLVMVQCFSGAFANLIFQNGDPRKALEKRDIAGFFATTKTRYAAGCTSEVDEAEYHDFTSYFFAALSGRDRVGRRVSGADFNRNGRVGMDEAFYFTVANDKSIDVPVATSDIFLRRFVAVNASSTRYSPIFGFASAGQRFALQKLSEELRLSGENRLAQAQQKLQSGTPALQTLLAESEIARTKARFEKLRNEKRALLMTQFPDIKSGDATAREAAVKKLTLQLERESDAAPWKTMRDAYEKWQSLESARAQNDDAQEVRQAHLLRFIDLHQSVALRMKLMRSASAALKNRFARLQKLEAQTLLPPAL